MTRTIAVAGRELRERWLFFPGALALGSLPFALPALGARVGPGDVVLMEVAFAAIVAAAAGVVVGSTMLARDAASGRLGFLFSRPVAWPTIWAGKWAGALVLVIGSALVATLPWAVARGTDAFGAIPELARPEGWPPLAAPVLAVSAVLVLVGLASFVATAGYARSAWLVVDFALLVAAVWAVRRFVAPQLLLGMLQGWWWFALLVAPIVVGLVAGSAAQVAIGRTDVRRAHRAASIVLWSVIGLGLVAAAGRYLWASGVGPADLDGRWYQVATGPGSRWTFVESSSRRGGRGGWYPTLLLETKTGRYVPAPDPYHAVGGAGAFSADGRYAVQPLLGTGDSVTTVALFDLTGAEPRRSVLRLESTPPSAWWTTLSLSPSGSRLLLAHELGASVFDSATGRRLATSPPFPAGWRPTAMRFVAEDRARLWLMPWIGEEAAGDRALEVRVLEFGLTGTPRTTSFAAGPTVAPAGAARTRGPGRAIVVDAAGERLLTFHGGLCLRDGWTGEPVATLLDSEPPRDAAFLADGRIVAVTAGDGSATLHAFGRDGASGGVVPLVEGGRKTSPRADLGPEVSPGRIAVSLGFLPFLGGEPGSETVLVDVDAGRVAGRWAGLHPVGRPGAVDGGGAGAVGAGYFTDGSRLVRIDAATGEQRVVAGPGAPRGERLRVN
jgi:hypothetical protein